jgi:hypothetical protein
VTEQNFTDKVEIYLFPFLALFPLSGEAVANVIY